MNKVLSIGIGAVVIDHGNRILLVKRGHPPGEGYWAVPGGHLEYGEHIIDACLRELEEETGITGKPLGVIWVDEIVPSDYPDCDEHFVLIDLLVEPYKSRVVPGSDALDAGFYDLESLPAPLTPPTSRLIRFIRKNIVKGEHALDSLKKYVLPLPGG
ncbi:MAG: NUDIX hydrolase [Crenarchaeota archaeon]|nr:NUDIX hydrolase [Thermoproteota archaeon]